MRCSIRSRFPKPPFLPPTKFSHLSSNLFKRFLEGEADSKTIPNSESQKKNPCPPTIDKILNRTSYNPPRFLDDLINVANEQAKRKPERNHYIEAGGWLLLSANGKQYRYLIKPEEEQDYGYGVYLNEQEIQIFAGKYLRQGWLIVAEFHTHSSTFGDSTHEGDAVFANSRKIPGFVIDLNGKTFPYGKFKKGIYGIGVPKGCE